MEDKVPSAYYKLTDNKRQIMSYVFDVIRGSVPRMELDEAFASKDHIANAVKDQLSHSMSEYGYEIVATLVVDLDPNQHVKAAMNEINGKDERRVECPDAIKSLTALYCELLRSVDATARGGGVQGGRGEDPAG